MQTHNERVTSNASEQPVVVFLIGMRVNRWWKVRQWLRTALAMPRMLRELGQHPELGMLGGVKLGSVAPRSWSATGSLSTTCSVMRSSATPSICLLGARSTSTLAAMVTSGSGTKRTSCSLVPMRVCT